MWINDITCLFQFQSILGFVLLVMRSIEHVLSMIVLPYKKSDFCDLVIGIVSIFVMRLHYWNFICNCMVTSMRDLYLWFVTNWVHHGSWWGLWPFASFYCFINIALVLGIAPYSWKQDKYALGVRVKVGSGSQWGMIPKEITRINHWCVV